MASSPRPRSWRWPATCHGAVPTCTRLPCGATACTSSTPNACTISRRSTRSRMSCPRTSTRSARCLSSRKTAARAWRRRTGPSGSGSRNESGPTFVFARAMSRVRDPLALAFQPLNPFRGPLDHAHERMELPFARDLAADEPAEHDLRARSFVRRVIRLGEQRLERLVELLFLHAGRFALRALHGFRGEKFVEQDGHRMREVEDRVLRGCRNGRQQVASPQFLIQETEVFTAEDERDPAVHFRYPRGEFSRGYGDSSEPLLALCVYARGSDDEIRILQRGLEVVDRPGGLKDLEASHGPLPCFRSEPARSHEHEVRDAEVLHGPRDGADIPLVLRLHEDDADPRHTALDILYRRYSLACASPSRSRTMGARSLATSGSRIGGPSRGSASPRCAQARSSRVRGNRSSGAPVERIGA